MRGIDPRPRRKSIFWIDQNLKAKTVQNQLMTSNSFPCGRYTLKRSFEKNSIFFLLVCSNWTVWKWKMKECEKCPGYLCVTVYLWNFSKKIENLFLLIFSNWITWNWNMINCEKFPGRLYHKWSGQFTFEYFRKKSKFLFYSFFRITSFTTEWWENVKHACLK